MDSTAKQGDSTVCLKLDVLIIGGGIAGLWLLNRLSREGRQVALFEQRSLGGGQTIASQGMIHGGIKYALGGMLTGSSEAIAAMPARWRQCLQGTGDVDLRGTKILSEAFYLWSGASISSRITSFFASKATRGRVENIARQDYPQPFADKGFKGKLYRLVDLVLDVPHLLQTISAPVKERIFSIDWSQARFEQEQKQGQDGRVSALILKHNATVYRFETRHLVLCAGEGNDELMTRLGIHKPQMQRRPLHQVLVKHDYPFSLYAHCVGSNPSPRLTVSSHQCADGKWVWYLGGDLATDGVHLSREQQIAKARQELAELFPWLDFSHAQWDTLMIDRAEPKQNSLLKPDRAFASFAAQSSNTIVAWPTKLTLAPALSDDVIDLITQHLIQQHLTQQHVIQQHSIKQQPTQAAPQNDWQAVQSLLKPPISQACWETLF